MRRTNIYLDSDQIRALDLVAAEEGISRSVVIRRTLRRALIAPSRDKDATGDAINDSFGVLQDMTTVPDREIDERSAYLNRLWQIL